MVGTAQPLCLLRQEPKGRYESTMNLRNRKHHSVSSHYEGWTARPFPLRFAVAGEAFVLTSLFIERDYRNVTPKATQAPFSRSGNISISTGPLERRGGPHRSHEKTVKRENGVTVMWELANPR